MKLLQSLFQDLKSGYRGLRRSPFFSAMVVATLALGIGATAALFAVVDAVMLRPLAGFESERLVWLQEYSLHREISGGTPKRFADWQQAHSFSAMCGVYSDSAIYVSERGPVRMRLLHTLGDAYQTLGPRLVMGRPFTATENRGEGQPVALITAEAWRREFAGDPSILKRTLRFGNADYQVVGVLDSDASRRVEFPEAVDVWVPASGDVAHASRQAGFLGEIARLAPGVSVEGAQAEVNLLAGQMAAAYPATDKGRSATLTPLKDFVSQDSQRPLLTLMAAAGAVLLIACVNIAGLLIARALARQREVAIRISVGAGFLRLARLFFAESLLLAVLGCAAAVMVAYVGIGLLKVALPPDVPHLATVELNWRVVAYAMGLAGVSAILFGGVPAFQFAALGQVTALKSGGRGTSDSGGGRIRAALVVLEVALSLVLLVTAGLLVNSFFRMRDQPSGFSTASVYSFGVPFGWDSDPGMLNAFASAALNRLTSSPGVVTAGVVDQLPLHGGSQSGRLLVQGVELDPVLGTKEFSWRTASAGYFSAAGVPLKAGSLYRDWQGGKGERDVVITDRLAGLLFPKGDAIGHSIAEAPRGKDVAQGPLWFRIVGVVGSVRLFPTDTTMEAGVYVPWGATYWPTMKFVVKSTRDLAAFSAMVRKDVQPLAGTQLVEKIGTLEELTAETRSGERARTIMLVAFAVAALALSALGLFGTLSHEVSRRTQDFGVRLALGAEPASIAWAAVKMALGLTMVGLVVGVLASVWTGELLRGLLFGVEPSDAGAYAGAVLVLVVTAVLAALAPALRAARIDPIAALKHE